MTCMHIEYDITLLFYYIVGYIAPDIIRSDANGSYDWNVDMFSVSEMIALLITLRDIYIIVSTIIDCFHSTPMYIAITDPTTIIDSTTIIITSTKFTTIHLSLSSSLHYHPFYHYHHHSSLLRFRSELWLMLCSVGMNPSTVTQRLN